MSLTCAVGCNEIVGTPGGDEYKGFLSWEGDCSHDLTYKRRLSVPRRTLCSWPHLLIAFTFLILTSLKGAKPSVYFPGHLLQAGTSVLMQVDEAVGHGGVCVAKKGWRCSGDHRPGDAAGG